MNYQERCKQKFPRIQPPIIGTRVIEINNQKVEVKIYAPVHRLKASSYDPTESLYVKESDSTSGLGNLYGNHERILSQADAAQILAPPQDWTFNQRERT